MHITSHSKRDGSALTDIAPAILGFGLFLFTLWGVGWSFYRHGGVHGLIALSAPPYAWYRGIAAIWEEPQWREKYDVETEVIAVLLQNSFDSNPDYQIASRRYIDESRDWLSSLPATEYDKLYTATRSFGLASVEYLYQYMTQVIDGVEMPHPSDSALIVAHREKFYSTSGYRKAWNNMIQESAILDAYIRLQIMNEDVNGFHSMATTDKDKAVLAVKMMTDAMSIRIDQTISSLFGK